MLTMRSYDVGPVMLNCAESSGAGQPLVLLHGIPGRWQEFLPLIPALVMRWHVYALDLRGHGASGRVPGAYRPADYISDVCAFLESAIAQLAALFGMSAGGLIAFAAAARRPDLVAALIVGDSPVDQDALVAWMSSEGFASHFAAVRALAASDHTLAEVADRLGALPVGFSDDGQMLRTVQVRLHRDLQGMDAVRLRGWAKTVRQLDAGVLDYHATGRGAEFLADVDIDATLSRITCPVLLVRADPERGALMSPGAAARAAGLLADPVQVALNGQGHDLGLDTWDVAQLTRAVTGFLDTVQ